MDPIAQLEREEARRRVWQEPPGPHPTTTYHRPWDGAAVQVDSACLPVLDWLNSVPGVRTTGCCQGRGGPAVPRYERPYAQFTCRDMAALDRLGQALADFATESSADPEILCVYFCTETEVVRSGRTTLFNLSWCDHLSLLDFIAYERRRREAGRPL